MLALPARSLSPPPAPTPVSISGSPNIDAILDFSRWHPAGENSTSTGRLPERLAIHIKSYFDSQALLLPSIVELVPGNNPQRDQDGKKYLHLRIFTNTITDQWLAVLPDLEKLLNPYLPRLTDKVIPKEGLFAYNHRKRKYDKASLEAKLNKTFEEAQLLSSDKVERKVDFLNPPPGDISGTIVTVNLNKHMERKENDGGTNRFYKADSASTPGLIRKHMEDVTLITHLEVKNGKSKIDVPLYAVFDGHAGSACAEFLSKELPEYLTSMLENILTEDPEKGFEDLYHTLKLACLDIGRHFKVKHSDYYGGSAAIFAIIVDHTIWVANVGDSRAILTVDGNPIGLSQDASLLLPKFQKQVQKRGQEVSKLHRVLGVNMARAIGHSEIDSGINPRASITCYSLTDLPNEVIHLLFASDGFWNVATNKDAAEFVNRCVIGGLDNEQIASRLVEQALKAGSNDNISAVVVEIKRPLY